MATAVCSLSEYQRIVSTLPRPTLEQVENFVQFVSDAHSWYKHLPLLPPGKPFLFLLDPCSGCDTIRRPDGAIVHEERTEASQPFHYTWMTTHAYRARFGHLAYATNAGTMFMLRTPGALYEYADLPMFSTVEANYHLPPDVAALGSVELTGVINHLAARVIVWGRILPEYVARFPSDPPRRWPAETGGDPTLRKILEVCERETGRSDKLDADAGWKHVKEVEAELAALLQPEKERLQARMTETINRVLDLLYPRPPS